MRPLRWEWQRGEDPINPVAWAALDLTNLNRLSVGLYWWTETRLSLEMGWGRPYSDPLWNLGVSVDLPRRLADWLGRHRVGS